MQYNTIQYTTKGLYCHILQIIDTLKLLCPYYVIDIGIVNK